MGLVKRVKKGIKDAVPFAIGGTVAYCSGSGFSFEQAAIIGAATQGGYKVANTLFGGNFSKDSIAKFFKDHAEMYEKINKNFKETQISLDRLENTIDSRFTKSKKHFVVGYYENSSENAKPFKFPDEAKEKLLGQVLMDTVFKDRTPEGKKLRGAVLRVMPIAFVLPVAGGIAGYKIAAHEMTKANENKAPQAKEISWQDVQKPNNPKTFDAVPLFA